VTPVAAFALAYLAGAFPTSYLAGRLLKGIDLREHGSKNLGATNVYRVLGIGAAIPVALVDILKGALPVWLLAPMIGGDLVMALLLGATAIAGHVWSVFVGFKGGKGVATAAGVMLALVPAALGVCFAVWLVTVLLTRYVSLGSILGALVLAPAAYLLHPSQRELVPLCAAVAAAIVFFHRANIGRLRKGTENKVGQRRPTATVGAGR
jgi:glycerol-3-phosphate acyltransferase PlsY